MIGIGGIRSATVIAGTCTVLIAVSLGVGQLTANGATCIQFNQRSPATGGALDPKTGASFGLDPTILQQLQLTQNVQSTAQMREFAPSPDGSRLAYGTYDTVSQREHLIVEANAGFKAIPTQSATLLVGDMSLAPYFGRRDFGWSPDSQWLAYWWREDDGNALLGLSDRDGRSVRAQPIGTTTSTQAVIYDGWSADGAYVAFSVQDEYSPSHFTLMIWSMPSLTPVQTQTLSYSSLSGAQNGPGGQQFGFGPTNTTLQWSPHGQQIAYLADDTATHTTSLAIASPTGAAAFINLPGETVYPSQNSNSRTGGYYTGYSSNVSTLLWSADGQSIVVTRLIASGEEIDLVNTSSQRVQTLTTNAALLGNYTRSPYVFWSPDGHRLYYMQTDVLDDQSDQTATTVQTDLFAFQLASGTSQQVAANVTMTSGAPRFGSGPMLFQQGSGSAEKFILLNVSSGQLLTITPPEWDNVSPALVDRQLVGTSRNGNRLVFVDHATSQLDSTALSTTYVRIWTSDAAGRTQVLYTHTEQSANNINNLGSTLLYNVTFRSPGVNQVSPDGRWLALTDNLSGQSGGNLNFIALDSGETRTVSVPGLAFNYPIAWRSDGSQLLLSGSQMPPVGANPRAAFILVDVATGTVNRVIDAPGYRVGSFTSCR